jgi:hypothetical protein
MNDKLITELEVEVTKNAKRIGEFSEAAFLHKAESLRLKVAKPWGDSERYDFILDSGTRLWKVQVKGTKRFRLNGYEVHATYTCGKDRPVYEASDIDVLAAHVIPLDLWYIVPFGVWGKHTALRFYPRGSKRSSYEEYREAWDIFRQPPDPPTCPQGFDPAECPLSREFAILEGQLSDNGPGSDIRRPGVPCTLCGRRF